MGLRLVYGYNTILWLSYPGQSDSSDTQRALQSLEQVVAQTSADSRSKTQATANAQLARGQSLTTLSHRMILLLGWTTKIHSQHQTWMRRRQNRKQASVWTSR